MASSHLISLLGPEYDDFVFAPIGEEKNGMLLRVVSALARLDLDPWQEAANLACLPRPAATERLKEFIVALPDKPSADLDPEAIAAGLIARLPPQPNSNAPSAEHPASLLIQGVSQNQSIVFLALVVMLLLQTLALAGSQPSTTVTKNASVPTPGKAVSRSVVSTGGS